MEELRSLKVKEVSDRLLGQLNDLVGLYKRLLELTRQESEAIQALDRVKIDELNQQKEDILGKIKLSDSCRERYARELAHLVNLESDYPRLLELAEKVTPPIAEAFRHSHAVLALIIERLTQLHNKNRLLVEAQLRVLQDALADLKSVVTQKPTYGKHKKLENHSQSVGVLRGQEA